jgi:hypothetical protein
MRDRGVVVLGYPSVEAKRNGLLIGEVSRVTVRVRAVPAHCDDDPR